MGDPEDRSPDQTSEEGSAADDSKLEIKSDDPTASQLFFGDHLENVATPEVQSSQPEELAEKPDDSASELFFGTSLEEAARADAEGAEIAPGADSSSSSGGGPAE